MKRKAFTLIELLVVISILALLIAILSPTFRNAAALARAAVCRNNLHHLSQAFGAASSSEKLKKTMVGVISDMGIMGEAFPQPMAWPGIPANVAPHAEIYQCPEDEMKESPAGETGAGVGGERGLKRLEYVCPYGKFTLDTMEGATGFYKSRRGRDSQGYYTEYLLQDDNGNGQFELMEFNGWIDTDGVVRIYDRGIVLVPDRIPPTPDSDPDWSAPPGVNRGPGYPNRVNTCGDLNAIYYDGRPAFGAEGRLRNYRGQTFELPNWSWGFGLGAGWGSGLTNYGINYYAHKYPAGSTIIVLVDYKETIVEIDTPLEAEELLLESGRHLGNLNYLKADGSVMSSRPLEISPRLYPELWTR